MAVQVLSSMAGNHWVAESPGQSTDSDSESTPMAFPAIMRALLTGAAADLLKTAVQKMPWAKDRNKVQYVERQIGLLVGKTANLARNLVPGGKSQQLERLLDEFYEDLVKEGISEADAKLVKESVRSQIDATVIQPLEDFSRIHSRLQVLEHENDEQGKQILSLAKRVETMEAEGLRRHRVEAMAIGLLISAVGLSVVAILLATVMSKR